jgi:hypothetical protein
MLTRSWEGIMKRVFTHFEENDLKEFEPEAKVGIIATVDPEGLPHITLITSLQAKSVDRLIWGQFCEGLSKQHVKTNPKTGFLIMTMDRSLWRGKARWTHETQHGEDYDMLNLKPMFRYNAYTGIYTVHYMDLVETYGRENLPLVRITCASILTRIAKSVSLTGRPDRILNPWTEKLFNRLDTVKFLSYVGSDGFPALIPLIPCQASDSRRLAFSPVAYSSELKALEKGMHIAIFGLTLDMEDVLVRGVFTGYDKFRGITLGCADIDWVYNSMPPKQGRIYPQEGMKPVTSF